MKRFLLLALLIVYFLPTQASVPLTADLIAKTQLVKKDVINISLANLQQKSTHIELANMDSDVIYHSKYLKKRNGFSQNLNLKELKDGRYLLSIRNDGKVFKQVIVIKDDLILFSKFKEAS